MLQSVGHKASRIPERCKEHSTAGKKSRGTMSDESLGKLPFTGKMVAGRSPYPSQGERDRHCTEFQIPTKPRLPFPSRGPACQKDGLSIGYGG